MKFSPFTYLPSIKITSKLIFKTGTLNSITVNQQRQYSVFTKKLNQLLFCTTSSNRN